MDPTINHATFQCYDIPVEIKETTKIECGKINSAIAQLYQTHESSSRQEVIVRGLTEEVMPMMTSLSTAAGSGTPKEEQRKESSIEENMKNGTPEPVRKQIQTVRLFSYPALAESSIGMVNYSMYKKINNNIKNEINNKINISNHIIMNDERNQKRSEMHIISDNKMHQMNHKKMNYLNNREVRDINKISKRNNKQLVAKEATVNRIKVKKTETTEKNKKTDREINRKGCG